jgi:hypothetical protein
LDEEAVVMFQVGKWPWELIICFLDVLIFEYVEVDEAMFEGDERQCNLIFGIQEIQKSEMDEVADAMFHIDE